MCRICDDRPERGAAALAALLPRVPRARLMLETDAPYLTPRSIKYAGRAHITSHHNTPTPFSVQHAARTCCRGLCARAVRDVCVERLIDGQKARRVRERKHVSMLCGAVRCRASSHA